MTELGFTDDPKMLVSGTPRDIHGLIVTMQTYSHAFEAVGDGLRKIDDGNWKGKAADKFRERFEQQPVNWIQAADAFRDGANALVPYVSTLEWAQTQAVEAVVLWKSGQAKTNAAGPSLFAGSSAGMALLMSPDRPPTVLPNDPGGAEKRQAVELLHEARRQLSEVASDTARKFHDACAHAPTDPSFLDNVGSFFQGFGEGLVDLLGIVNPANWKGMAEGSAELVRLAAADPDAAFKQFIDYDGERDNPAKWAGGLIPSFLGSKGLGKLGRLEKVAKLTEHLDEHLFRGHVRIDRISGYHFRPGGEDLGDFRLKEVTLPPDKNGVYQAVVEGTLEDGSIAKKTSTFFPDNWSKAEVKDAVLQAFEHREPVLNKLGEVLPNKWQGVYNGVTVEGLFKQGSGATFSSATLDDVGTAYPKYGK
ncbi:EndoU domain-containing protein [Amycolatopsis sp. NPDC051128]|uniref:EndoU domain-containing protein n=1 Tax=Amycolatopsis sp. NPDC051128 TaxID=3155412 RepID=UPI003412E2D4